jgi:hypothetical protein
LFETNSGLRNAGSLLGRTQVPGGWYNWHPVKKGISMQQVKVVFESEDGTESLWATPVDSGFVIDNYPFYLKGVCFEDLIEATPLTNGLYQYVRTVEKSNNSLYRVFYEPEHALRAAELLADLHQLGCHHGKNELVDGVLAAVNIPGAVNADIAWKLLETGLNEGTWVIQEGDDRHPCIDDEACGAGKVS